MSNEMVQVQLQPILQADLIRYRGTVSSLGLACRGGLQDWPKTPSRSKVPQIHLAPWAGPLKPFLAPSVRGLGLKGQSTWLHPLLGPDLSCQKAFPRAVSPATCPDRHDPQRSAPKWRLSPLGKAPRCRLSRCAKLNPAYRILDSFLDSLPKRGCTIPAKSLI